MFKRKDSDNLSPNDPPASDAGFDSGDFDDAAPTGESGGGGSDQLRLLTIERDEARGNLMRALADFQNYQRRALSNELEAKRQGIISVVTSVLPVLDHFDLALTQATPDEASRRIMDGVRVVRDELIKALGQHGVMLINPQPNDEFDPARHSAIAHQPGEGVAPGHISMTFQPGYLLGERMIRPAKVAVAPTA
jgi:molecular chaperone GrpE